MDRDEIRMTIRPTTRQRVEGSQIAGSRRSIAERIADPTCYPGVVTWTRPALDRHEAQVRLDELERMDALDAESDADMVGFGVCD